MYLDSALPEDWYSRDLDKRRDFHMGPSALETGVAVPKDFVSCQEIRVRVLPVEHGT